METAISTKSEDARPPLDAQETASASSGSQDQSRKNGSASKTKKTVPKRKARKAVKKKPEDMPRRPLSAYNYFFSEMRSKLVADRAEGNDIKFREFLESQGTSADGSKKNGFFSNMGKFVAKRWKELSQEEMKPYTDKADADLERYRKEMDEYREGVARKTRLASEKKLREQEAPTAGEGKEPEAAPAPPQPAPAAAQRQAAVAAPWAQQPAQTMPAQTMSAAQQFSAQMPGQMQQAQHPLMQGGLDPTYQLLLRQQLLQSQAQNPQLSALLLQQALMNNPQALAGAMGGFFGQQAQMPPFGQQMMGQNDMTGRPDLAGLGMLGTGEAQPAVGSTNADAMFQHMTGQQLAAASQPVLGHHFGDPQAALSQHLAGPNTQTPQAVGTQQPLPQESGAGSQAAPEGANV